jgi:16S rRNA (guanine(966)-N(2))-methyltransferase RsmD
MILSPRLPGASILDLYAGSGALGIEALSRGAERCLFVESDRQAVAVLGQNLARLGLGGRSAIAQAPVERWLERADRRLRFDLVLMDPPYRAPGIAAVLRALVAGGRLAAGGRLVFEHDRRLTIPAAEDMDPWFRVEDERRYGDTIVSFLALESAVPPLPGPGPA